jgi:hypothetical protein
VEGVPVPTMPRPLTRRRWRQDLAAAHVGHAQTERLRQGTSEVELHARLAVDKVAVGKHRAKEPSIEAPPGSRGARTDGARSFGSGRRLRVQGNRSWRFAVKRSSTRGSVGRRSGAARAEASRRGRVDAVQKVAGPRGAAVGRPAVRESDGMQGARVESRLQKSERRIFPEATAQRGDPRARARSHGGRMARGEPPAFDGAGCARRGREGAMASAARVSNERDIACPDREIRDDPTEGVLVRAVHVALTRRRARRIWSGVCLRAMSSDVAQGRPRSVGLGARAEGASDDTGRQRFRWSGLASPADGRRRSAVAEWSQRSPGRAGRSGAEARMA